MIQTLSFIVLDFWCLMWTSMLKWSPNLAAISATYGPASLVLCHSSNPVYASEVQVLICRFPTKTPVFNSVRSAIWGAPRKLEKRPITTHNGRWVCGTVSARISHRYTSRRVLYQPQIQYWWSVLRKCCFQVRDSVGAKSSVPVPVLHKSRPGLFSPPPHAIRVTIALIQYSIVQNQQFTNLSTMLWWV